MGRWRSLTGNGDVAGEGPLEALPDAGPGSQSLGGPDAGAAAIEAIGLSKTYGNHRTEPVQALAATDLRVGQGEFVAVVGPSGCGKTTLMKLIAGLLEPTTGELLVGSEPVCGPRPDIGIVFQQPLLLPWRDVSANVVLPAQVQRVSKRVYGPAADKLLDMVGLQAFRSRYPHELSGGMQQRVAICRALVNDPAVLLMDEPFGALDAMTREKLNNELLDLWQQTRKTILFITHSISEAVYMADRVVVMTPRPGKIQEIIDVDAPRPRRLEMLTSGELAPHVEGVRRHFQSVGGIE